MDGRILSSAEDVQRTLYKGPDWCRGYLLRRPRQQVSKGGSVKEYVNYVSVTEYGLDCQSRRSKSCVVNDGSLSTEVLRVAVGYRGTRSKVFRFLFRS